MYCLQKRTRVMVDVIVSASRLRTPQSNPRTSWAQVSCFQKRAWVTAKVLVRLLIIWTDAQAS
jgi:hypothetical protein